MDRAVKTVMIQVYPGFSGRYLLRTDIFGILKAAGVRIVILTPPDCVRQFREEFQDGQVVIEALPVEAMDNYIQRSRLQRWLVCTRSLVLGSKSDLGTVKSKEAKLRRLSADRGLFGFFANSIRFLAVFALRRSRFLRRLLVCFEAAFFRGRFLSDLFMKYRPDMVITTSLGYHIRDAFIMREGRQFGSTVVAVILSWDNTSAKGMAGAPVDRVVAWTEHMCDEIIRGHDIPPGRVFVGGVAHFDAYYEGDPEVSADRSGFFNSHGLDPARKTLLFGTGSPSTWHSTNLETIRVISQAMASGTLITPCQLLVRLHPIYFADARHHDSAKLDEIRREVAKCWNVHINMSDIRFGPEGFDFSAANMYELRETLRHSDVLVTPFSTLILEACICRLPVINVCFSGHSDRLGADNGAVMNYAHIKRILATRGAPTAHSPEALVSLLNRYLENPTQDAHGRELIVKNECGPFQGKAGESVANHLLSLLDNHGTKKPGNRDGRRAGTPTRQVRTN